jgi:F-type H+-transporting ATPase subunit delta
VEAKALSRKYATAVFSQALEKWVSTLRVVSDKLSEDAALANTLQDSDLTFAERKKALDGVIPDSSDQYARNFLHAMLKNGDMALLPQVLAQLGYMMSGGPQVQVATITTAFELADEEKEEFRKKLRQKYGEELELEFNKDESLVGGAVVQMGDKVIDGSVATRLSSMRNLLGVR